MEGGGGKQRVEGDDFLHLVFKLKSSTLASFTRTAASIAAAVGVNGMVSELSKYYKHFHVITPRLACPSHHHQLPSFLASVTNCDFRKLCSIFICSDGSKTILSNIDRTQTSILNMDWIWTFLYISDQNGSHYSWLEIEWTLSIEHTVMLNKDHTLLNKH